jgi:hypothetical protein
MSRGAEAGEKGKGKNEKDLVMKDLVIVGGGPHGMALLMRILDDQPEEVVRNLSCVALASFHRVTLATEEHILFVRGTQ